MRAIDFVRDYFRDRMLARRPGLAPFAGGAVGYLAYDAARWFEPVLERKDKPLSCETQPLDLPTDALWMFYRNVIAFDRVRQQMEIISIVLTEEAEGSKTRLRELYDAAVTKTAAVEADLLKGLPAHNAASKITELASDKAGLVSNWTRRGFEDGVRRIKEHIAAGDCYQVVLSQRFSTNFMRASRSASTVLCAPSILRPTCSFCALVKRRSSAPRLRCWCAVTGSGSTIGRLPARAKRGATETEDWMLGEDLKTDEKEVAEHMMLVDLGRNDLGRVADYGSVKVEELMAVERYSHVQHLVTSLRARLRDGLDRFDALASCFPAGTVTGAPKIRAMEIISELEPDRRGIYAGSVLYLDYADNLDSCIAIRTIELRDGKASVQAGAGIVADSVPEHEYAETVNKARGCFARSNWRSEDSNVRQTSVCRGSSARAYRDYYDRNLDVGCRAFAWKSTTN